jgi:hypothetical protein
MIETSIQLERNRAVRAAAIDTRAVEKHERNGKLSVELAAAVHGDTHVALPAVVASGSIIRATRDVLQVA